MLLHLHVNPDSWSRVNHKSVSMSCQGQAVRSYLAKGIDPAMRLGPGLGRGQTWTRRILAYCGVHAHGSAWTVGVNLDLGLHHKKFDERQSQRGSGKRIMICLAHIWPYIHFQDGGSILQSDTFQHDHSCCATALSTIRPSVESRACRSAMDATEWSSSGSRRTPQPLAAAGLLFFPFLLCPFRSPKRGGPQLPLADTQLHPFLGGRVSFISDVDGASMLPGQERKDGRLAQELRPETAGLQEFCV